MASPVNAALCALLATAFWSLLGYVLTRHLLPRALAIGAAPVTGWAVHSAATLPIFFLIGFSPLAVVAVAALCVAISVATLKLAVNSDAEAANLSVATLTATQSAATATTASGENPIRKKIGSVAALWTAQPVTGAAPMASTRGSRWRVSA